MWYALLTNGSRQAAHATLTHRAGRDASRGDVVAGMSAPGVRAHGEDTPPPPGPPGGRRPAGLHRRRPLLPWGMEGGGAAEPTREPASHPGSHDAVFSYPPRRQPLS